MSYVSTDAITPLADTVRELERELGASREALDAAVVEAHAAGRTPGQIARDARLQRRQVYTILNRNGVELDSEVGRRLVGARKRHTAKAERVKRDPATGLPLVETPELTRSEIIAQGIETIDQRDLFEEPDDGEPAEEIGFSEYIARLRSGEAIS